MFNPWRKTKIDLLADSLWQTLTHTTHTCKVSSMGQACVLLPRGFHLALLPRGDAIHITRGGHCGRLSLLRTRPGGGNSVAPSKTASKPQNIWSSKNKQTPTNPNTLFHLLLSLVFCDSCHFREQQITLHLRHCCSFQASALVYSLRYFIFLLDHFKKSQENWARKYGALTYLTRKDAFIRGSETNRGFLFPRGPMTTLCGNIWC